MYTDTLHKTEVVGQLQGLVNPGSQEKSLWESIDVSEQEMQYK